MLDGIKRKGRPLLQPARLPLPNTKHGWEMWWRYSTRCSDIVGLNKNSATIGMHCVESIEVCRSCLIAAGLHTMIRLVELLPPRSGGHKNLRRTRSTRTSRIET
ncbi:uncharacterized protein LOC111368437 [Olea europaea var. sylvestris]|uniref:uncharacterized protein LOC111368437 n=1 Tax=Olea europaea var. sylvestris TaxID=158386 RepID=UPI000C1D89E5|nr:uncharacterized protein LOC111368437 [Olea europaea var. sylvestris]